MKSFYDAITIDYREKSSILAGLLAENFSVTFTTLPYGDYLLANRLTIERKTARDFLVSIIDLRLFKQVIHLKRQCQASLLLIEGDPFQTELKFDHRAIWGALLALQAGLQIPVVYSTSPAHSCEIITMIIQQEEVSADVVPLRGGYRPKRLRSRQLYILQGLPGVGPELAKRLLCRFHSVAEVMVAGIDELVMVEGIGRVKAGAIRQILDAGIKLEK